MVENLAKIHIIFGGTFDPIHNGHIRLAHAIYKTFAQQIIFTPVAVPNYKAPPIATGPQRLDMLRLAINNNPHFIINSYEILQAEFTPTVNSLEKLRTEIGELQPIYFVIGEDALLELDSWDNWRRLFCLTNFIVVMRPGYNLETMSAPLKQEYLKRSTHNFTNMTTPHGQIYILDFKPLDISSTKIRNNIAQNLPIEQLVDPAVMRYITDNNVYFKSKFC